MKVYAIGHKATNELMPLKWNRKGYTHWNPATGHTLSHLSSNERVPRLFPSTENAKKAIISWATFPNMTVTHGDEEFSTGVTVNYKRDGRKADDLEVITVSISGEMKEKDARS